MNLGLRGRNAIVTGGSRGLGLQTAIALGKEGCNVAICSRNQANLDRARGDFEQNASSEFLTYRTDVSNFESTRTFIEDVAEKFGGIDIAVANAGGPANKPIESIEAAEWMQAIQQNFVSTANIFQLSLPYIKRSNQGRLLTITSIAGKQPLKNMALSNCARAAVHGLVKTLSIELGSCGVTVNAILPGITNTQRIQDLCQQISERDGISIDEAERQLTESIPLQTMGSPEDFGAVTAFLCSRQASFINGIALLVDGGQFAGLP